MAYLVDANVMITPFATPSLHTLRLVMGHSSTDAVADWLKQWFLTAFTNGHLVGSRELISEVQKRKDIASQFARTLADNELIRLLDPLPETFNYLAQIEKFVRAHFRQHQVDEFSRGYDGWYIALAKTYGIPLVTFEGFSLPQFHQGLGKIDGKVRIPFIAWVFEVKCVSFYQVLSRHGTLESTA
ncbi:DUF4411 family protein [Thermaerobacter sp. PB12/4term]|uniref:DUF4411 family protein n=1 Tax=Thermaerobacter sp. PB12/4term TaxID=2293838 RepID=UPI000E3271C0|nr:DUF4411 family protein [Thermaerobacter sp. PB12/4term]QIA26693.1 DUF4411 family protein [Thermaerobacter sp. PB12/4term]